MSPRIMCHHYTLTEPEREFIDGKVKHLRKYYDRISEISVILDSAKNECVAEMLVFGAHLSLRVKFAAEDMRSAFEGALNKAERTLTKVKSKKWGGKKHGRRNVTIRRFQPDAFPLEPTGENPPQNVRDVLPIEHIEPHAMSLYEARDEMQRNKNGILVFVNQKTDEINLLHRNAKNQIELVELTGTVLFQPASVDVAAAQ